MAEHRYPKVRALFDAMNDLASSLQGPRDWLLHAPSRHAQPGPLPYTPRADLIERAEDRAAFVNELELRQQLEDAVRGERGQQRPPGGTAAALHEPGKPTARLLMDADAFWESIAHCRESSKRARAALAEAQSDIDGDETRPLRKASHLISQAIHDAERALSLRMSLGWDPFRWPPEVAERFHRPAMTLGAWLERIRPLRDERLTTAKPAEGVRGHGSDQPATKDLGERPDGADVPGGEALTGSERIVLTRLAELPPTSLVKVPEVVAMLHGTSHRRGEAAVKRAIRKLVRLGLVERPEGTRSGCRATQRGREVIKPRSNPGVSDRRYPEYP